MDICLSNSEDFCLSFLLKATLANGHFLTQTQLPRVLLSTGKTKADFEHLEDILHPANARHTIQEYRAECRRVFGWVPDLVRTWVHN